MGAFNTLSLFNRFLVCTVAGVSAVAWASAAAAYTPNWLECDGQMVTTTTADGKAESTSAPAKDVYVYDDDSKNFYKYSETRKTTDVEPVTSYTDKEIKWSSKGSSANAASWDGTLNRSTLALQIDYNERGTEIVWTQQCKPTQPIQ